jgi:ATPase domain predominantly from Archaea/Archaea bacterial proteins of unknown function
MYGRRRTGKTFLLQQFLSELDAADGAYHACSYRSPADEMASLTAEPSIRSRIEQRHHESIDDYLDDLETAAENRLLVVVIDELPYLIEGLDRFPAALQKFWDRIATKKSHLMLVLTGSAISTMTTVVSSGGPLFMRPTKLMQIEPFDFSTSASFLGANSESSDADLRSVIEARSACGGYPLLLDRWDKHMSAEQNLIELASDPLGPLVSMSSVLLLDLPDARGVRTSLSMIGRGVHKQSEIQSKADQRVESALSTLVAGGYVRTHVPIGSKEDRSPGRKLFRIADEHLLFYFAIVDPFRQLFEANQGRAVLAGAGPRWANLVQSTFERDARQTAVRMVEKSVLPPGTVVGEWWTDRPEQAQVDIVGVDVQSGDWSFAGEAKWVERFGTHELQKFQRALATAGPVASTAVRSVWVPTKEALDIPTGPDLRAFTLRDFLN